MRLKYSYVLLTLFSETVRQTWQNCIVTCLLICESDLQLKTRWWFQIFFCVHPYLGKWSILTLTNMFFKWVEITNQKMLKAVVGSLNFSVKEQRCKCPKSTGCSPRICDWLGELVVWLPETLKSLDLFGCLEVFVKAITMETVFTEDRRNPVFQLMAMEHGPGLKMRFPVKNGDFVQPAM